MSVQHVEKATAPVQIHVVPGEHEVRVIFEGGVVTRHVVASSPPSVEYALTDLGRELIPVINAIVKVGEKLKEDAAHEIAQARRAAARAHGARA